MTSFFITIIFMFLLIRLSHYISKKFNSQGFFISPPFIGAILLLSLSSISYYVFEWPIRFNIYSERLFVTIFLFSIGFQIALIYTKLHWKRFFLFIGICAILLLLLALPFFIVKGDIKWIFGTLMFGYTEEMVHRVAPVDLYEKIFYWSTIQMGIVFFLTPILLLFIEKKLFPSLPRPSNLSNNGEKLSLQLSLEFIMIIFLGAVIVIVKKLVLQETIPFLFDFVISMFIGFGYGKWSEAKLALEKLQKRNETLHQLGTIGLYAFIIISINDVVYLNGTLFESSLLIWLLIKTVVVAVISIISVRFFFKKFSYTESLVAIVAGWTFMLNAPVVCMHGMRTVVNKYGPAPDVLLIVPPVILWLVNYLHLMLYLIL